MLRIKQRPQHALVRSAALRIAADQGLRRDAAHKHYSRRVHVGVLGLVALAQGFHRWRVEDGAHAQPQVRV